MDEQIRTQIEETRAKHEFLTFLILESGDVKVGIVQNESIKMVMLYDFEKIHSKIDRKQFLKYGDEWWWGSNQSVPVDSFIGDDFNTYHIALTGYPKKSITNIIGPTFSIQEQYLKRIKKKKIEILHRPYVRSATA